MKLKELEIVSEFDAEYYDYLQGEMRDKKAEKEFEMTPDDDSAGGTSIGDFIVSAYEVGKIDYDQALAEIKAKVPEDEWYFWEMELFAAKDAKEFDGAGHEARPVTK